MENSKIPTVVSDNAVAAIIQAVVEKKEWVRKVQAGKLTYTKGKRIA
ncbi:hypothetical protein [Dyadobacter sp.]